MADAPTGYAATPATQELSIAQVERAQLCDLFDVVGPHHRTLCEGWTTHHLAAHLKVREGGPMDFVRNAVPGDKIVEDMVEKDAYEDLVAAVRRGPALVSLFSVPKLGEAMNTLEFFIHHEDVRRGEDGWQPRELPRWVEDRLWGQVVKTTKLTSIRSKRQLTLRRADTGAEELVSKGSGARVLTGLPSELVLYVAGRKSAAQVATSD